MAEDFMTEKEVWEGFVLSLKAKRLIAAFVFFTIVLSIMGFTFLQVWRSEQIGETKPLLIETVSTSGRLKDILSYPTHPKINLYDNRLGVGEYVDELFPRICGDDPHIVTTMVPHVIVLEDVSPDMISPGEMDSLMEYMEYTETGFIGIVVFGDSLETSPDHPSWFDSRIVDLLPVRNGAERIASTLSTRVLEEGCFEPLEGLDFSTLAIGMVRSVTPKDGADVPLFVVIEGEEYPLLVHWEFNHARILVWTGSLEDLLEWDDGREFVRRLVEYAAGVDIEE